MRYSMQELEAIAQKVLNGLTPDDFLTVATQKANAMFAARPNLWRNLGPYWPVMQKLIQTYQLVEDADDWNNGEPSPTYLRHYDTGDNLLNWCAAMSYFDRNGDYVDIHAPHQIELPNGDIRLYMPGVGLVDDREVSGNEV